MITFIETDYYSSQAAPRLAILPGPNSLEQHTCVKLSGTLTGPSEQGGKGQGDNWPPRIEVKPSPSKGLGLLFAPPDFQTFLRPSQGNGRTDEDRRVTARDAIPDNRAAQKLHFFN